MKTRKWFFFPGMLFVVSCIVLTVVIQLFRYWVLEIRFPNNQSVFSIGAEAIFSIIFLLILSLLALAVLVIVLIVKLQRSLSEISESIARAREEASPAPEDAKPLFRDKTPYE